MIESVLKLLALVMMEKGETDEALSYIEAAVDLQPDVAQYRHLLGRIRAAQGNMPEAAVRVAREMEHVTMATGALVHPISNLDSITGIHLDEFNALSGGLVTVLNGVASRSDHLSGWSGFQPSLVT